jgi:hypothetical protein
MAVPRMQLPIACMIFALHTTDGVGSAASITALMQISIRSSALAKRFCRT